MHPLAASTACRVRKTLGIDLGTTNSVVALLDPTDSALLTGRDASGRLTVPSVVAHDPKRDEFVVGHAALLLAAAHASDQGAGEADPSFTPPLSSVKRFMGTPRRFTLGPHRLNPAQVSARILAHLRDLMAETLHRDRVFPAGMTADLGPAIITMPAYFNHNQIEATRHAGELAGLDVVELLHEPTAAAVYYSWLQAGPARDATYLVYDLGGGTFDASVIRRRLGDYEVLSVSGDSFLGGDDFDRLLATHLIENGAWTWQDESETDELHDGETAGVPELETLFDPLSTSGAGPFARLVRLAEGIKCALTGERHVRRLFPRVLTAPDGRTLSLEQTLDRDEFNRLIKEKVDRTIDCCHEALGRARERAGIRLDQIDHVILVGGSSRTPLVRETVRAAFCNPDLPERVKSPEILLHEPDLCVAYGAALRAATHGTRFRFLLADPHSPPEFDLRLTSPACTADVRFQAAGSVRPTDGEEAPELLEGASVRIRSLATGLVEESFLDGNGSFAQELELQPEADNAIEWGVCDATGRELVRLMTTVRHRAESRPLGEGVLATQLITRPLAIEVLTPARRRVKQVVAPIGAALPGKFRCVCRTTDQSGRVVVPIFEDNRVVKQLVIDNLPVSLPVGSPVEVEFAIAVRHTIEVSVRVRGAASGVVTGEADRCERVTLEAAPPDSVPTREEIDEAERQINELLPRFRGALRARLRARAGQLRRDLLEALSYDDEPRAVQRMAELRGLVQQMEATEGLELDPPWPRFAQLVERCQELAAEVGTRTGRDPDELLDYVQAQERYAEQAYEENNQALYRECHDNLTKYAGYLDQLRTESLPQPSSRPSRPPEQEARDEVERFRGRLSLVWKQARARGRPELEARLGEIASQASGLNQRMKTDPLASVREARRLVTEVEKIAAQLAGRPRPDPGGATDSGGLLEGSG